MILTRQLTLALVVTVTSLPAMADFGAGNQAYEAGRFDEARIAYQAEIDRGIANEELYYNLGNAHFRLGQFGPAIYNYERALRIEPDMVDARYNLDVARSAVGERIRDRLRGAEVEPWWVRAVSNFTLAELALGVLCLDLVFFALLIALRFLDSGFRRSVTVVVSGFVGVALLTASVFLLGGAYLREQVTFGIVLPDQVAIREGKGTDTAERGQLHAGLRVRVLEQQGAWARISLANGVEGWVEANHVGIL